MSVKRTFFVAAVLSGLFFLLLFAAGRVIVTDQETPLSPSSSIIDSFSKEFNSFEALASPLSMPDLALFDLKGQARSLKAYKGRVVLINLWATWCAPCVTEIPTLMALEEIMAGPDFAIVYISLDFPESPGALTMKMKRQGIPLIDTFYTDDEEIMWGTLAINGLPMTILLDTDGHIIYRMSGDAGWSGPEALAFLRFVTQ